MRYCFGIDVGGTTVKMGLFQWDGTLLEKWEIKTHVENEGEAILSDIAWSLEEKRISSHIEKEDIDGIGIGIPAPVDKHGVVQNTANLGWGYKEVTRELMELTGYTVVAGNDANVAALGEMWKGGGMGYENLILITLGTGLGGSIILEGKNLVGEHGAAGEFGHIQVEPKETEYCGCGRKGCLEQYTSATGIRRLAIRRLKRDEAPSILRQGEVNAKTVFDAVKAGDAVAYEIATEFGQYLGTLLAKLCAAVDPAIIVIGGGVSKAGEILLDFITPSFYENAFFANKDTKFAFAKLGNDAGMYGAVKMLQSAL